MKSTLRQSLIVFSLFLSILGLALWSWVLLDLNFTLLSNPQWATFRNTLMQIGYFNRPLSATYFVTLVIWLFINSLLMIRYYKGKIIYLVLGVGIVAGILSYPALSHDLFNYIFDARILTHYGQNPYLHKALDFPGDPMLRFMHWTHRTYPYGPSFLLLSLIPSFLGFGKFALTFMLFKLVNVVLYCIAAVLLARSHKQAALLFITSPLVIVEGLMNTHNDFVAVAIALIAVSIVGTNKRGWTRSLLIFSGLVKYLTIPAILLGWGSNKKQYEIGGRRIPMRLVHAVLVLVGVSVLIYYVISQGEIQPWYFLNLLVLLPYFPSLFLWLSPFFMGLVLSYYPYVIGGEWGQGGDVGVKRNIIWLFVGINIGLLFVRGLWSRRGLTETNTHT
jgi:hypothetical protein